MGAIIGVPTGKLNGQLMPMPQNRPSLRSKIGLYPPLKSKFSAKQENQEIETAVIPLSLPSKFIWFMDKALQSKLLSFLLPYHPIRVGIFGSYARGEQNQDSDLDILIHFRDRMGLLALVQIEQALADELGIPIDLVTENSLKNPRIKQYIYKDLITIYE